MSYWFAHYMKRLLPVVVLVIATQALDARFVEPWTYQQMFEKADLVVIARPINTSDTAEHQMLPDYAPPLPVIGVTTEFETRLVLKGSKDVTLFKLHHFRYRADADETAMSNTPELLKIKVEKRTTFLLFLIKERDGRYAPVTGQTDPAISSVLKLDGAAE
jgi:hypothetical protein